MYLDVPFCYSTVSRYRILHLNTDIDEHFNTRKWKKNNKSWVFCFAKHTANANRKILEWKYIFFLHNRTMCTPGNVIFISTCVTSRIVCLVLFPKCNKNGGRGRWDACCFRISGLPVSLNIKLTNKIRCFGSLLLY